MSDRTGSQVEEPSTRIWWDGNEVRFIRWSERGLIFNWGDPRETAIHMPRGALMRLMEKGVIYIEGEVPEWITALHQDEPDDATHPLAYYNRLESVEQRHASESSASAPPVLPKLTLDTNTPPPIEAETPSPTSKLSIVARLIRKLGGGSEHKPTPNQASTSS